MNEQRPNTTLFGLEYIYVYIHLCTYVHNVYKKHLRDSTQAKYSPRPRDVCIYIYILKYIYLSISIYIYIYISIYIYIHITTLRK